MLTDKEMLKIAELFIKRIVAKNIEPMIIPNATLNKPYGNIYFFNSKKHISTGDPTASLVGSGPFIVEKETGRVVGFGSLGTLEDNIKSYENGTMTPSLDLYWYPDEDRFDYK
ncbi:YrhB domain-containing protein [Chryseobacterium sp.]|uniref:YrhB domain-containing protein n=1 Tax=Chryseobacterium sp. TaxID=1871047 RepID=UPI0031E2C019